MGCGVGPRRENVGSCADGLGNAAGPGSRPCSFLFQERFSILGHHTETSADGDPFISASPTFRMLKVRLTLKLVIALLGGVIYAAAGALIGSMNAGGLGLERNANAVLPALGVGAGLVVIAFCSTTLHVRLREIGTLGRVTQVLIAVGPLFFVLSWIIEFAIVGTLCLGLGLVCLSVSVTRWRLVAITDRVLIILSAVGSLTRLSA
jgi:hypothetical protein